MRDRDTVLQLGYWEPVTRHVHFGLTNLFSAFLSPLSMYLVPPLWLISILFILLSRKIHPRRKHLVGRPSFYHWIENLGFYLSCCNSSCYGDIQVVRVALILLHNFCLYNETVVASVNVFWWVFFRKSLWGLKLFIFSYLFVWLDYISLDSS